MNRLFIELVQVSLGLRVSLSHMPQADEWVMLYDIARKQSLVGICFAGVQRLQSQQLMLSEKLYITWMGMAAKIQQRNEVFNKQCAELQEKLSSKGFRLCVLKGQGVAIFYNEHLVRLRQPGDIDLWIQNKSIEDLVVFCNSMNLVYKVTAAHIECEMLGETVVELHADPAFMRFWWADRKLKKWFAQFDEETFSNVNGMAVPSVEFNLVYMMVHMYHHVLFEGLGLRQLMDYYFVLRKASETSKFQSIASSISYFGMMQFAAGIMWIMKDVFALENKYLVCEANEKYGRRILEDVIRGGNFGHYDERNKGLYRSTAVGRSLYGLKRNMKFFALGPWEILSSPVWSLWHYWWRKHHGFK